jgi:hypothetical protein
MENVLGPGQLEKRHRLQGPTGAVKQSGCHYGRGFLQLLHQCGDIELHPVVHDTIFGSD